MLDKKLRLNVATFINKYTDRKLISASAADFHRHAQRRKARVKGTELS